MARFWILYVKRALYISCKKESTLYRYQMANLLTCWAVLPIFSDWWLNANFLVNLCFWIKWWYMFQVVKINSGSDFRSLQIHIHRISQGLIQLHDTCSNHIPWLYNFSFSGIILSMFYSRAGLSLACSCFLSRCIIFSCVETFLVIPTPNFPSD